MNSYVMVERVRARSELPLDTLDIEESLNNGNAARAGGVPRASAGIMQAVYATTDHAPLAGIGSVVVRYCPAPPEPVWRSAETPSYIMRPTETQPRPTHGTVDGARVGRGDLADLARERGATHEQQAHLLLEQLAARHAVSREIRREILEEECRIESQLWRFAGPVQQRMAYESRFALELVRELEALRREARAETVACWRDTTWVICRLSSDRDTDYEDGARRTGWAHTRV